MNLRPGLYIYRHLTISYTLVAPIFVLHPPELRNLYTKIITPVKGSSEQGRGFSNCYTGPPLLVISGGQVVENWRPVQTFCSALPSVSSFIVLTIVLGDGQVEAESH